MSAARVMSADEAASLVRTGDVVAVCGVVWNLVPEVLLEALERRFLETGEPRGLTETHLHVYGLGPGVGLERFAHKGMTTRVIGGSFAPPYWFKDSAMNRLVDEDEVEAFLLPAGVVCALWRATGARRPGILSEIGIKTFVDPRDLGGRINESARRSEYSTSEVVELGGRDWLFYRSYPIDVSFIRATSADTDGNLALEGEPLHQAVVQQALAAKGSGGIVIAQVKQVVEAGSLDPRLVKIPGFLVDAVVEAPDQRMAEYGVHADSPAYVGDARLPAPPLEPVAPGVESLIAYRAAREVHAGDVINLGAGLPVIALTRVLRELGLDRECTISVEHGSLGGVNLGEFRCNAHWNPTAQMDSELTFDFYTSGALSTGFLGAAQVDGSGSVNVSKVGNSIAGVGGFMDIAQGARKVVFCTSLTYRDQRKFVKKLAIVSFSGPDAVARGQRVLYVTERCVFELAEDGLVLIEVSPGIEIERDIAPHVEFPFRIAEDLATTEVAA
jgi:propionate CoA-transferase